MPELREDPEETRIEAYVAEQIRTRRKLAGLNQTELARALGISFQMIGKYENAANRLTVGRLCRIARVLGISVEELLPPDAIARSAASPPLPLGQMESGESLPPDGPGLRDMLEKVELVQKFSAIDSARARRLLISVAETFGPSTE
ncbi:Transcriptional regulator, contains XRE-family HTH domain [Faunimonas pinastri]|uniref:Transcriptional regulator, contains XRE-family HTH domain n=1 Tax=Faunimonas pinastri TaxID=1855383 RepID=A0A1H9FHX2_9HYPH|nr:helix-turn-helix domain-containing protein [Faunimonas pinastri]SEQ37519.1 Transcriptional regulator, contains XRE-family HTH domain [Faunimonas pinastri]